MYWHGNIIAEGMVVQRVDAEEQQYIHHPAPYRDLVLLEEEGRACSIKLPGQPYDGYEEELDEGEKQSCPAAPQISPRSMKNVQSPQQSFESPTGCYMQSDVPLSRSTLMIDSSAKTLEQQPPKMSDSIAPTASHCGIVSMKTRPTRAIARLKTGLLSSMPYISAFSREGAALITRGDGVDAPDALSARSLLRTFCCCLCSRRREMVMAGGEATRS